MIRCSLFEELVYTPLSGCREHVSMNSRRSRSSPWKKAGVCGLIMCSRLVDSLRLSMDGVNSGGSRYEKYLIATRKGTRRSEEVGRKVMKEDPDRSSRWLPVSAGAGMGYVPLL